MTAFNFQREGGIISAESSKVSDYRSYIIKVDRHTGQLEPVHFIGYDLQKAFKSYPKRMITFDYLNHEIIYISNLGHILQPDQFHVDLYNQILPYYEWVESMMELQFYSDWQGNENPEQQPSNKWLPVRDYLKACLIACKSVFYERNND